ncbi:tachykinins-like [Sipha flava]|uniref:Tachykinins-like n=1 Tax=Sipha flava TaxID=143950 RepID=A0A2S2R5B4_9HEMI|nr:tachykinins-like [Sipha flava]
MPRKINVGLVTLAALATATLADPTMDRRASMGFMGMRGKKDDQSGGGGSDEASSAAAIDLDKRTLVFRQPLFGGDRTALGGGGSAEGFKRAMGFMGMRGKKEYYKGSAAAGFFGMRGKKVPSADAFFGVRGKKWPGSVPQPLPSRDDGADDVDVERAVFVLHRIIDNLRSDQERSFVATKFNEEQEMR